MKRIGLSTLLLLACCSYPPVVVGQTSVLQGGTFTPGHPPIYSQSGGAQPIVIDAGPAGGNTTGQGLSELNVTARGTGAAPYVGQGTGPNGEISCVQDAVATNATGYHYLCFSANAISSAGSGGLISYGAAGAATVLPLNLQVNGQTVTFPPTPTATGGCTPIENYGGGTSVADNTTAWTAFLAGTNVTGGANQGCLAFGAGRYTFLGSPTAHLAIGASIAIKGAGPEQTQLYFPNGTGIKVSYASTGLCPWRSPATFVEDIAFISGVAGGNTGFWIDGDMPGGCPSKPQMLTNTYFRGVDDTTYWNIGVRFTNVQNAYVDNFTYYGANQVYTAGTGILYETDISHQTTVMNLTNAFITFADKGLHADGYFQGVEVVNGNFNRVNYGLYCNAAIAEPQCSMSNSAVEAEITSVYWNNIVGSALTGNLLYIGLLANADQRPGILMQGAGGASTNQIVGNQVTCSVSALNAAYQANGINLKTGAGYNTITGNTFQGCRTSIVYESGAVLNLDASNVNINGTYYTDANVNPLINSHDWLATDGTYHSSFKYFDSGLTGVSWLFGTDPNGALSLGANGKSPYINFVCNTNAYCIRTQAPSLTQYVISGFATDSTFATFVDTTGNQTNVNYMTLRSAALGSSPELRATGNGTVVNLVLGCKGAGCTIQTSPGIAGNGFAIAGYLYQTVNINATSTALSASYDHGLAIGWNKDGDGAANYITATQTPPVAVGHKFGYWNGATVTLASVQGSYFQTSTPVGVTGATYTVDVNLDYAIIGNRAGTITLTLPSASGYPGRAFEIKTIQAQQIDSASSNVVPLAGGAAGTAIVPNTAGKWAIIRSNGTNWEIMASN